MSDIACKYMKTSIGCILKYAEQFLIRWLSQMKPVVEYVSLHLVFLVDINYIWRYGNIKLNADTRVVISWSHFYFREFGVVVLGNQSLAGTKKCNIMQYDSVLKCQWLFENKIWLIALKIWSNVYKISTKHVLFLIKIHKFICHITTLVKRILSWRNTLRLTTPMLKTWYQYQSWKWTLIWHSWIMIYARPRELHIPVNFEVSLASVNLTSSGLGNSSM